MTGRDFIVLHCLQVPPAFVDDTLPLLPKASGLNHKHQQTKNKNMQLQLADSSAIRAVGYDGYTLTIEFHTGRIYDHPGVPHSVYVEFMNAPSPGTYYNRYRSEER